MKTSELISLYKASPEWRSLSKQSRRSYSRYLALLPEGDINKIPQGEFGRLHASLKGGAGNSLRASTMGLLSWANHHGYSSRSVYMPINRSGEIEAWKMKDLAPYLEQALSDVVPLAITLGFYTAQRLGDVLKMKWDDVSENGILVKQEKTGTILVVPVHPKLQAVLDKVPRKGPYIIQHHGRRYSTTGFRVLYRRVVPKSLPPFHGIRKASCIALAEGGATTHEIMSISGHSSLRMVHHYTKGINKLKMAQKAIKAFD